MNREKQIEEMARTMCGEKEHTCEECDSSDMCEFWTEASVLYEAGYRKQIEGEWLAYPDDAWMKCSVCGKEYLRSQMPHTVGYCPNPNCGAKMKGGEGR